MKHIFFLLTLILASSSFASNYSPTQPQDSISLLGNWQMDSTYFFNGDERNGAGAVGKNVWVFKADGVLEVHMEGIPPFLGSYTLEGTLLQVMLFGSKDPYQIVLLTEDKLDIVLDPSSKKMKSENVFRRVEKP